MSAGSEGLPTDQAPPTRPPDHRTTRPTDQPNVYPFFIEFFIEVLHYGQSPGSQRLGDTLEAEHLQFGGALGRVTVLRGEGIRGKFSLFTSNLRGRGERILQAASKSAHQRGWLGCHHDCGQVSLHVYSLWRTFPGKQNCELNVSGFQTPTNWFGFLP